MELVDYRTESSRSKSVKPFHTGSMVCEVVSIVIFRVRSDCAGSGLRDEEFKEWSGNPHQIR